MLPLYPAIMALTLIIGFVFSMQRSEEATSYARVISDNLLLEHQYAVRRALDEGLVAGTITDALQPPLRSMGEWQIDVVASDGKVVVVTYLPEFPDPDDGHEKNVVDAFNFISSDRLRKLPESYAGVYTYSGAGIGGMIGTGNFRNMDLPIPENHPAIITVVNPNYTPPVTP